MISETSPSDEAPLQKLLPSGWSCSRASPSTWELRAPDGRFAQLRIEQKERLPPIEVYWLREKLRSQTGLPLLVADWLSPLTRRRLREVGIAYLDRTGNAELSISEPGLFIRSSGAQKDPDPPSSRLGSLKGAGSGRAMRALVDHLPPYGIRALAQRSGSSAPVLSRVASLLAQEGLLQQDERGHILQFSWEDLLRRWAEDYRFGEGARSYLDPRGLFGLLRRLPGMQRPWAATGSLGVPPGAGVAPLSLASLYVDDPEETSQELGLSPVDVGANVLLIPVGSGGALLRRKVGEDGLQRCHPSQVVVDLLCGPGRGEAEGEALIAWMTENVEKWRVLG